MMNLQEKFLKIETALNAKLVERGEPIHGMILSALAGEHVLLLGPPGTAKSNLANDFCAAVGAKGFSWLMSRFTVPEELFGPLDFPALKNSSYVRNTTDRLPEADVVFLDEIFKANSAISNTLLTAINEREFHNGGKVHKIPLRMLIGASNELPTGSEMGPYMDRFILRYWITSTTTLASFTDVMTRSDAKIERMVTLEQWDAAREQVQALKVSPEIARLLFKLRADLKGATASDRRWKKILKIAKAQAWLTGSDEVSEEHFAPIEAALWNEHSELPEIRKTIGEVFKSKVAAARAVFEAAMAQLRSAGDPQLVDQAKLVPLVRDANRARGKLDTMSKEAATDGVRRQILAFKSQLESAGEPFVGVARAAVEW